ncbi:hypothetical protein M427DRAFT_494121 [Gonapodya prolifera JEL478]|uniref:Uncharacterized protein n=1 Tax=Gonapodya prolifera (strain JEL478) TaxID=1344416 RepID=A0A139AYG8_GONPJ|nr:hypothetical protein M427DRAFT_494121 [Gonapodya prolifera JEL478]|eukprot:KXS21779.1 hypothetical protein M427DRAFT_494121 [Gonapodya prolifera JEL478]
MVKLESGAGIESDRHALSLVPIKPDVDGLESPSKQLSKRPSRTTTPHSPLSTGANGSFHTPRGKIIHRRYPNPPDFRTGNVVWAKDPSMKIWFPVRVFDLYGTEKVAQWALEPWKCDEHESYECQECIIARRFTDGYLVRIFAGHCPISFAPGDITSPNSGTPLNEDEQTLLNYAMKEANNYINDPTGYKWPRYVDLTASNSSRKRTASARSSTAKKRKMTATTREELSAEWVLPEGPTGAPEGSVDTVMGSSQQNSGATNTKTTMRTPLNGSSGASGAQGISHVPHPAPDRVSPITKLQNTASSSHEGPKVALVPSSMVLTNESSEDSWDISRAEAHSDVSLRSLNNRDWKEKLAKLETERDEVLRQRDELVEKLANDGAASAQMLESANSNIALYKKNVRQLSGRLGATISHQNKVEEGLRAANKKLEKLRSEVASAKAELAVSQAEVMRVTELLAASQAETEQVTSQLTVANTERIREAQTASEERTVREQAEREYANVWKELDRARIEAKESSADRSQKYHELAQKHQRRVQELEQLLETEQSVRRRTRQKLIIARQELEEQKQANSAALRQTEEQAQELNAQKAKQKTTRAESERVIKALQAKVETFEQKLDSVNDELRDVEKERDSMKKERDEARADLRAWSLKIGTWFQKGWEGFGKPLLDSSRSD